MPHFDTYPVAYSFPVYSLCWVLLWSATRPNSRWFLPGAFLLLFLLRLPGIVFNGEINPDESQMITQGMTLARDPVYFRSVDGTTGGPLDSYFLVLPGWFGLPADFITAHFSAFLLVSLSFWLVFLAVRRWFGQQAAQLAVLPFIFLLGLTQNGDFIHYNSELIAICLLGGAYLLYARQTAHSLPSMASLGLMGLLLGMVPFGKLQGVPLAAVTGLFAAIDILLRVNITVAGKAKRIGILVAGGIAFPALFTLFMWSTGMLNDFVTFYIQGNFNYASGGDPVQNLLNLPRFFRKGTEFEWLVYLTIALFITALVVYISARRQTTETAKTWQRNAFILTLLAATLYAITKTGSEYVHYLYFLMGPLCLLAGFCWSNLIEKTTTYRLGLGFLALYLLGFAGQMVWNYRHGIPLNPYPTDQQGGWRLPQSDVAKVVRQYAQPGEKLVVWGWRCDYYVQTQMPQGVAENHTIRSTFDHPMLGIYQKRYVSDFKRSFPPVFVDAVGSQNLWMTDKKTQGYEIIKPLAEFVNEHYQFAGIANDARIYVRNDRIKKQANAVTN
nr:hypothetical protein [uncultured Arsenicibacter sp.]